MLRHLPNISFSLDPPPSSPSQLSHRRFAIHSLYLYCTVCSSWLKVGPVLEMNRSLQCLHYLLISFIPRGLFPPPSSLIPLRLLSPPRPTLPFLFQMQIFQTLTFCSLCSIKWLGRFILELMVYPFIYHQPNLLSIYSSSCIHLSIFLYPSIHLLVSIYPSSCIHLSIFLYPSIHLLVSIYPSSCIHLSIFLYPSIHLLVSIYPSSCIHLFIFLCPSIYLLIAIYPSSCMYPST